MIFLRIMSKFMHIFLHMAKQKGLIYVCWGYVQKHESDSYKL